MCINIYCSYSSQKIKAYEQQQLQKEYENQPISMSELNQFIKLWQETLAKKKEKYENFHMQWCDTVKNHKEDESDKENPKEDESDKEKPKEDESDKENPKEDAYFIQNNNFSTKENTVLNPDDLLLIPMIQCIFRDYHQYWFCMEVQHFKKDDQNWSKLYPIVKTLKEIFGQQDISEKEKKEKEELSTHYLNEFLSKENQKVLFSDFAEFLSKKTKETKETKETSPSDFNLFPEYKLIINCLKAIELIEALSIKYPNYDNFFIVLMKYIFKCFSPFFNKEAFANELLGQLYYDSNCWHFDLFEIIKQAVNMLLNELENPFEYGVKMIAELFKKEALLKQQLDFNNGHLQKIIKIYKKSLQSKGAVLFKLNCNIQATTEIIKNNQTYIKNIEEFLFVLHIKDYFQCLDFFKPRKEAINDSFCYIIAWRKNPEIKNSNERYNLVGFFKNQMDGVFITLNEALNHLRKKYIPLYISLLESLFTQIDFECNLSENQQIQKKISKTDNNSLNSFFLINQNMNLYFPKYIQEQIENFNKRGKPNEENDKQQNIEDFFYFYIEYFKNTNHNLYNIVIPLIEIMKEFLENNQKTQEFFHKNKEMQDLLAHNNKNIQDHFPHNKLSQLFFTILFHISKTVSNIIDEDFMKKENPQNNLGILSKNYINQIQNQWFNMGILKLIYDALTTQDEKDKYGVLQILMDLFDKAEDIINISHNNEKYCLYKDCKIFDKKNVNFKYKDKFSNVLQEILLKNKTYIKPEPEDYLQDFCNICNFINNSGLLGVCFEKLKEMKNNMDTKILLKKMENNMYREMKNKIANNIQMEDIEKLPYEDFVLINKNFINQIMHFYQENLSKFMFSYQNLSATRLYYSHLSIPLSLEDYLKLATVINEEINNIDQQLKQEDIKQEDIKKEDIKKEKQKDQSEDKDI